MNLRILLSFSSLILATNLLADDKTGRHRDITIDNEPAKALTAQQIRERLEVKGEVFVLDSSGKQITQASSRTSTWRFGRKDAPMNINFGSENKVYGRVNLHQVWNVNADGSVHVLIEEYANDESDPKTKAFTGFKDLLKKEEFTLQNFAPIVWKVQNNKEKNVVVRLTPYLQNEVAPRELTDFPISGTNIIIIDNKGYAWTDQTSFGGKYVSIRTHRGTIAMSYRPFKGGAEIGFAQGRSIVLRLPQDLKVTLYSETAFLPGNMSAKIYGAYFPERRSSGPGSVTSGDTDKEDRFLSRMLDQ